MDVQEPKQLCVFHLDGTISWTRVEFNYVGFYEGGKKEQTVPAIGKRGESSPRNMALVCSERHGCVLRVFHGDGTITCYASPRDKWGFSMKRIECSSDAESKEGDKREQDGSTVARRWICPLKRRCFKCAETDDGDAASTVEEKESVPETQVG